jgi:hypothetical protein
MLEDQWQEAIAGDGQRLNLRINGLSINIRHNQVADDL